MKNIFTRTLFRLIGLAALLVSAQGVQAQITAVTCTATLDGPWTQAATWADCRSGVPQSVDTVIIPIPRTVTIPASTPPITVNSLTVGGTLDIGSGSILRLGVTGPGNSASFDFAFDFATFSNVGTLRGAGTLTHVPVAAQSFVNFFGGAVEGNLTLGFGLVQVFGTTFRPGGVGARGTINIGGDLSFSGNYEVDVGLNASGFPAADSINVSGALAGASGQMLVKSIGAFVPAVPSTLSIISAGLVPTTPAIPSFARNRDGVPPYQVGSNISINQTIIITFITYELRAAFTPNIITAGGSSTLSLTLTNASAGDAPIDSFSVAMVSSIIPGPLPSAACGGAVGTILQATPSFDQTTVRFTGGSIPGNGTCTVDIPVTSITPDSDGSPGLSEGQLTPASSSSIGIVNLPRLSVVEPVMNLEVSSNQFVTITETPNPILDTPGANTFLTVTLTQPNGLLNGWNFDAGVVDLPLGMKFTAVAPFSATCTLVGSNGVIGGTSFSWTSGAATSGSCIFQIGVRLSKTQAAYFVPTGRVFVSAVPYDAIATRPATVFGLSASPTSVAPGGNVTVTVTNPSPTAATLPQVSLNLPNLSFTLPTPATACGTTLGAITSSNVSLFNALVLGSGSCSYTLASVSPATPAPSYPIGGGIDFGSDVEDAGVLATVVPPEPLTMTAAFSPTSVATGATSVLTVTLTSTSGAPVSISGASVVLPAGLGILSTDASSCGTTATVFANAGGTNTVSWLGSIPFNSVGPSSCQVLISVSSAMPGSYALSSGGFNVGAATVSLANPTSVVLEVVATVTPSAGANGTISPNTAQTVASGATTSFTVTPNAGFTASVAGTCGGTLSGTAPTFTYTTNAVTANCTVIASFAAIPVTFTVTPSAGANGTISPNTAQTVASGATTVFTVTPNTGFTASVGGTCGGTLVGTTYTTNAITANCTVIASFAAITFTVTPSVTSANGTISPNTAQTVASGATTVFTVTPNTGFTASVAGTCGGTLVGTTYTTNAITANCTVIASFAAITFTVTPSVTSANGTINPNTAQAVASGATTVFTVTPNTGFTASVAGTCGGTLVGTTYTTNAITANCTVIASFATPAITLNPVATPIAPLNFGSITINTTSVASTVTLTNSGTAPLGITSITPIGPAGDFSYTTNCPLGSSTVAPGGMCMFTITFTPATVAAQSGAITIISNATGSPHFIYLTGTGTAALVPNLGVNPTSLSFTPQVINTRGAQKPITIESKGTANLNITGFVVPAGFVRETRFPAVANACPLIAPFTVAPGLTCIIAISPTPTTVGVYRGTLTIVSDAGSATVALEAIGAPVPVAVIAMSPVADFGNIVINTTSPPQQFLVSNTGQAALFISNISLTGANAGDFTLTGAPCTVLVAGFSCGFEVSFRPGAVGSRVAQVRVDSNASNPSAGTLDLRGTGLPVPAPVAVTNVTAIGFGNNIISGAALLQTFNLTNTGTAPMNVASIGVNLSDYVVSHTCPAVLNVDQRCAITITFSPIGIGARPALVSIITNATPNEANVSLSGTGCRWFTQAGTRLFTTLCGN